MTTHTINPDNIFNDTLDAEQLYEEFLSIQIILRQLIDEVKRIRRTLRILSKAVEDTQASAALIMNTVKVCADQEHRLTRLEAHLEIMFSKSIIINNSPVQSSTHVDHDVVGGVISGSGNTQGDKPNDR